MNKAFPVVQAESLTVLTVQKRLPDQRAVARELAVLLPQVRDVLKGPPMALRLGFPRDGSALFDLAFPVGSPLERKGFTTKHLTTFPAFSIRHDGPLAGHPEGATLGVSFQAFASFARASDVMLGDDPIRFLYHAGLESVDTDEERLSIEILYPYHTPVWLDAFRRGVRNGLAAEAADCVLQGSEGVEDRLDGRQTAEWVQAAVSRLDQEIEDDGAKACILNACAHRYIEESALQMKATWDASGHDLRRLVLSLGDHPYFGATYRLDESGERPRIHITRAPADRVGWVEATDPVEKRYYACFCPLVRDAIRDRKVVSRSFCHCSGGWFVQEWQVVFGRPPKVDLLETMLEGAGACVFAVEVPEGFLLGK